MAYTSANISIQKLNIINKDGFLFLQDFSWELKKGKIYSLVGESGSGKTTFALSLFGILPKHATMEYQTYTILGKDWREWEKEGWNNLRGKSFVFIPQNPHVSFHPYRRIGPQILEFLKNKVNPNFTKEKVCNSWEEMGIHDPSQAYYQYPSSLSGGEKQRICISLANLCDADWVVADEPTSALDPIQEKRVIQFLLSTVYNKNCGLVFISHNLSLVSKIAEEVLVIQSGKIVEKNIKVSGVFQPWVSLYAKKLWEA